MQELILTSLVSTNYAAIFEPYYADRTMLVFKRVAPQFNSVVDSAILGNRFSIRSEVFDPDNIQYNDATKRGYAGLIRETPDPVSDTQWSIPDLIEKVSNQPAFDASVFDKSIIVAPYKRRTVSVTFQNGSGVENARPLGGQIVVSPIEIADILPWTPSGQYPNYFDMGNDEYLGGFSTLIRYMRGEVRRDIHPYALGISGQLLESSFSPAAEGQVDPAWVQSAVAEANKKALDWLTLVGELPETISSIIGAVRTVRGLIKSFDDRGEALRKNHKKWVESLRERITDLINQLSKAKFKTLRSNLYRQIRRLNRDLSREGKILITKLANLWMSYRYEITPLMMTVRDAVKAAKTIKNQFFTTRKRQVQKFDPPNLGSNWVFNGRADVTTRIMVKYGYRDNSDDNLSSLSKVLSANFALTSFELISRSFVVDWFFTVGDFLASEFGYTPNKNVTRAATLSHKCDIVGQYVEVNTGAIVNVNYSSYIRHIPDLGSFSGIYFRPNLTLKRMIDSFCLLWPSLKRNIR